MITKFYEVWFNDGSRVTFLEKEISEYARLYNFSKYELIHKKEADLFDDEGDLVGGVQQI
jgi:hypothetical protein